MHIPLTLLEKIQRLTHFSEIKKVKEIFLDFYNNSLGNISSITGTLVDNTDPVNPVINSPVTQTITNGAITTSPSEDVLFDALALKANLVGGKVPAGELPSYVDDVIEVANFASLPVTGETGKIYVALDTNLAYRWTGSIYVEISPSSVPSQTITNGVTSTSPSEDAVFDALALKAPLASPSLTGIPTAPTAIAGTNTTQLATTAFTTSAIALAASPLATLDEGNGNGIVRAGRTAANYGNVGNGAVDLALSDSASSTKGATGTYSYTLGGINNSTNGTRSGVIGGYDNAVINGQDNAIVLGGSGGLNNGSGSAILGGVYNYTYGSFSATLGGQMNFAKSYCEVALGTYPTNYTAGSTSSWVATDRVFNVGNGVYGAESNAFTILKSGQVIIPTTSVYADNTAALAGGLTAGMIYRTSTGVLMITY